MVGSALRVATARPTSVTAWMVARAVPAVQAAMVVLPESVALPRELARRARRAPSAWPLMVASAVLALPVVPAMTPRVTLMALPAVTVVPVAPVARVATPAPGRTKPMAVPAVLVARRGLQVAVRRTPRPLQRARRRRPMVLLVAPVVRAAMVAMVVPAVSVVLRPTVVLRARRVRWVWRPVVRPVVRAVPAVPASTRQV
jgi:hypothetical protein